MNDKLREIFEELEFESRRQMTEITGSSSLTASGKKRINLKYREKVQKAIREANHPREAEQLILLLLKEVEEEVSHAETAAASETFFSMPDDWFGSNDWFGCDGIRPSRKPAVQTTVNTGVSPDWLFRN